MGKSIDEKIGFLSELVTDKRKERFLQVLNYRTRHFTVVLENIFQSHNISAVLRSCDCMGIQDVHIVENKNSFRVNPDIALGADKWLNIFKYNTPENSITQCINGLKKEGYRIVATLPNEDSNFIDDFEIDKKAALIFGTEMNGLSNEAIDLADEFIKIPMFGFTESFNISVSAGICLHHLTHKLRNSLIKWSLSEKEKKEVYLQWLKCTVAQSDIILKEFEKYD